ncbi:hypothetical protein Ae201684_015509 [Aphanomyces euteiches]|uniref:FYVE-type domain-containing protein n=1 Tax=Aphanomyces euteiches TaxID=100861 RepID=A0A6G0WGG7_9STRA|nr:hypothetical protein Ae201684_015509 [Aphanomyces euteiches]
MSFLDVNQFVTTAEQDQCRLCRRSFGILRPKQRCRRCGHVVCSHCFKSWEIPINHKFVLTPICTKCTHQVIQVDDHFEVASVVSSIVRPIVLSGAMLVGPRSSERDFAQDKASAHRVLICDCDRDGKTVPCIEEEDVVDGGAMANSMIDDGDGSSASRSVIVVRSPASK